MYWREKGVAGYTHDSAGSSMTKMTSMTCERMRARAHQVHKTVDRLLELDVKAISGTAYVYL